MNRVAVSRIALAVLLLPWLVNIGPPRFRRFIVNILRCCILPVMQLISCLRPPRTYTTSKRKRFKKEMRLYQHKLRRGRISLAFFSTKLSLFLVILILTLVPMKDNDNALSTDGLSDEEILGQLSTLIFAASDKVQEKLRQEI
ncbi:hypothetical protein DFH07DRAFT_340153 [Mycena maculata]|uniref:Transmembrane protein n=1 Tax=Mycena maculata TaxID=230809 RepID=A0AAD7HCQ0_9AGAR|nr:hypothetical protein DFH07DRAFT_340153 [Mycena maculata]